MARLVYCAGPQGEARGQWRENERDQKSGGKDKDKNH
jgi:hypothetical protein